ncbi:hypothetical protein [Rossellomorea marisflavi]|uniref:hypothetical protein n=1 Tax=Rossellomorea marisflavi TaxID=189381 RepID=UPI0015C42D21|nr:hypothetical protein [Rossellomorea marisflavi]
MKWVLYDIDGAFLQQVNCEYDSCDIAQWEHGATDLHLDFHRKEARIITRQPKEDE